MTQTFQDKINCYSNLQSDFLKNSISDNVELK